mmetsp:Transcript_23925/g.66494  ORF Transcript_23925/g.66494 Transcript_23925/m.66494 type:complete len:226 (+) Transcript_23925:299-976(+)
MQLSFFLLEQAELGRSALPLKSRVIELPFVRALLADVGMESACHRHGALPIIVRGPLVPFPELRQNVLHHRAARNRCDQAVVDFPGRRVLRGQKRGGVADEGGQRFFQLHVEVNVVSTFPGQHGCSADIPPPFTRFLVQVPGRELAIVVLLDVILAIVVAEVLDVEISVHLDILLDVPLRLRRELLQRSHGPCQQQLLRDDLRCPARMCAGAGAQHQFKVNRMNW